MENVNVNNGNPNEIKKVEITTQIGFIALYPNECRQRQIIRMESPI